MLKDTESRKPFAKKWLRAMFEWLYSAYGDCITLSLEEWNARISYLGVFIILEFDIDGNPGIRYEDPGGVKDENQGVEFMLEILVPSQAILEATIKEFKDNV